MSAIRILSIEDSPFDAELIDRELRRSGIDVTLTRVDREDDFRREIASGNYDIVLADYNLPEFHGIAALEIAREVAPGIPFIFVSGSIGEERATQTLREGATDYVLKDRLKRLPSAITRALAEATERRLRQEAEESLRQREKDLERARRVDSLGRVAATMAHEFNNIMMGIQPFAEVIRRRSTDEKILKAAEQIVTSVARGRRVTQEILRFTKPTEPALTDVVLEQWVRGMLPELRGLVGPKVPLELESMPQPLTVRIDQMQMQQVLTNLVINARDAMPDGGTIIVAVGRESSFAVLSVRDTGSGIPENLMATIFDPLFTTKRHGTGLGLAIAQQIVTAHGGTISVQSAPGKGTLFTLRIPVSGSDLIHPSRHAARAIRRLILVDRDRAAGESLARLLSAEGIEARVVSSPEVVRPMLDTFQAGLVATTDSGAAEQLRSQVADVTPPVEVVDLRTPYCIAEVLVRLEGVRSA